MVRLLFSGILPLRMMTLRYFDTLKLLHDFGHYIHASILPRLFSMDFSLR